MGFIGLAAGGPLCDMLFRITGNPICWPARLVLVICLLAAAAGIALAGLADTWFPPWH